MWMRSPLAGLCSWGGLNILQLTDFCCQSKVKFATAKVRMLWRKRSTLAFAGLWFLFVRTALPCPPTCQSCSEYTAECEQVSSLSEVLASLSTYTESILLRHGNLSNIPQQSFTKFYNLRFLSITGFLISALTNLTFATDRLNSLKRLDLSDNHLHSCTIEPMAFSGLVFLNELILTNNSLDIVRRSWFIQLPLLSKLFLGFNKILYLAPRTFESLAKLTELDVSSNLIQYLPMDTFYGLPSLTRLDLSSNRILFINHEVFQPLQGLRYLLLFRNRLTILPLLPTSIIILFLHENPWDCSCKLASTLESLAAKIHTPGGVVCDKPPNLAGHQVVNAKPQDCLRSAPNLPLSPSGEGESSSSSSSSFPSYSSSHSSSSLDSSSSHSSSSLDSSSSHSSSSLDSPSSQSSSSSSSSLASSSSSVIHSFHIWLTLGVLGGLLVGVMLCLMCCFCLPRLSPCMFQKWSCCDPYVLGGRGVEWMRPPSVKPVVTLWEPDKAMSEIRVREKEIDTRGPVQNGCCCQRRYVQRSNQHCCCVGVCCLQEHYYARGEERGFHGPPFQQATSQPQTEKRVMEKNIETNLDGQTTAWVGGVKSPPTLVHIDCSDGRTVRIGNKQAMVCSDSAKPPESWRGALHIGGPRSRSGSLSNGYKPLKCSKESAGRLSLTKRRRPRQSVKSREPSQTADYSSESVTPLYEDHKKQMLGNPPHRGAISSSPPSSPSSQTEDACPHRGSYVKMLSIGHQPVKKKSFPQTFLASTRHASKTDLETKDEEIHQRQTLGTTSTAERFWCCQRCGYKEDQPCSGVLKPCTQQETTYGSVERMPSDAITHIPTDTGCNVALATLPVQVPERLRSEEPQESYSSPTLQTPAPATPNQESYNEASYEYTFVPDATTVALQPEHSQQVTGTVLSMTGSILPQLDQERTLDVGEIEAECDTKNVIIGTEDPLDDPSDTLVPYLAQGDTKRFSMTSDTVHIYSSVSVPVSSSENNSVLELSGKSRNRVTFREDHLVESMSLTSSCHVFPRISQLEFPLLVEEEEPSSEIYEDDGGAGFDAQDPIGQCHQFNRF